MVPPSQVSLPPSAAPGAARAFGFALPWPVEGLDRTQLKPEELKLIPELDRSFQFEGSWGRALVSAFLHNRRAFLFGPPATGKSSSIEQVAARLHWPCLRISLDGHLTRQELVGRDVIRRQGEATVTEFMPGALIWAMQRPVALILDEYDAARPEVLFVLQQVLEPKGAYTILETHQVVRPHPLFRLFATGNTPGTGDLEGIYAGTNIQNQSQMDRWPIMLRMEPLSAQQEQAILLSRAPALPEPVAAAMVELLGILRRAHGRGEITPVPTLRTLVHWAEAWVLLQDIPEGFRHSYFHRCHASERDLVAEFYQRCMGHAL